MSKITFNKIKGEFFPITYKEPHWFNKFCYWVIGEQARPYVIYVHGPVPLGRLFRFATLYGIFMPTAEIHVMEGGHLFSSFEKEPFELYAFFVHDGGSISFPLSQLQNIRKTNE